MSKIVTKRRRRRRTCNAAALRAASRDDTNPLNPPVYRYASSRRSARATGADLGAIDVDFEISWHLRASGKRWKMGTKSVRNSGDERSGILTGKTADSNDRWACGTRMLKQNYAGKVSGRSGVEG